MRVIVIPMAGRGERFLQAGFSQPKMLIPTNDGTPLLEWACMGLRQLGRPAKWVFVCLEEHLANWSLESLCRRLVAPDEAVLYPLPGPTEGQICSVRDAAPAYDSNDELIIHNCDTYVPLSVRHFDYDGADGVLPVFTSCDPRYSYVATDADGNVVAVREKTVLSGNHASSGTYAFRRASLFLKGAQSVLSGGTRIKGEYYVSSVYGPLISSGRRFRIERVEHAVSLGTPEELDAFNRSSLGQTNAVF